MPHALRAQVVRGCDPGRKGPVEVLFCNICLNTCSLKLCNTMIFTMVLSESSVCLIKIVTFAKKMFAYCGQFGACLYVVCDNHVYLCVQFFNKWIFKWFSSRIINFGKHKFEPDQGCACKWAGQARQPQTIIALKPRDGKLRLRVAECCSIFCNSQYLVDMSAVIKSVACFFT